MKAQLVRAAALTSALNLFCGLAPAGVVIQYENTHPGHQTREKTGTMWVEKDRLRMDMGERAAIYRVDKQVLWVLQEKEGTYMEMSKEQMKQVGEQLQSAMTQVQEQIKDLPPEQRKMVEQMMAGKMGEQGTKGQGPKKEEPRTLAKTGKTETINGYPCVSYEATRGGRREQEIWVTDWKRFDLSAADFKVLEDFSVFIKDAMGPLVRQFSPSFMQKYADTEGPGAVPGVPIRTVTDGPGGQSMTELKKIAREEIPASRFEIPAGLKKQPTGTEGN